jgi:DNA replication protein DnaC
VTPPDKPVPSWRQGLPAEPTPPKAPPKPVATSILRLEDLPPAAKADRSCPRCHGGAIDFRTVGEQSIATRCGCVPECPRCLDSGTVTAIVSGQVRTGRCRCQQAVDRARLYSAAQIRGRYTSATFESYTRGLLQHAPENLGVLDEVSRWMGKWQVGRENRGLIIWGPVGRGKTHLLIAIVRDLILRHGVPARFVEFTRLLAQLKAGYSEGKSGSDVIDPLVQVPVLAIDELGKGRLTDWELTIIDEIISRRYNAMACTMGSTNFKPKPATGASPANAALVDVNPQTLGDRVGDRVLSRLNEMCDFVELAGRDFRNLSV